MSTPVAACRGCVRVIDGRCFAMTEPAAVWAAGRCWAYTNDVRRVERELMDCVVYGKHAAGGLAGVQASRFLRDYRRAYGIGGRDGV